MSHRVDVRRYETSRLNTTYVAFAPNRPPLDDERVRRALSEALEREQLLRDEIGMYEAFPAEGGFVAAGMPGHSPHIGSRYDPQSARRRLAEAGYANGEGFPSLGGEYNIGPRGVAAEIARQWHDVLGIHVDFRREVSEADYLRRRIDRPLPPLFIGSWYADYPDPHTFLAECPTIDFLRVCGWQDRHYDALVEQARQTTDRARRLALYREADRILVAEQVLIVPIAYGAKRKPIWTQRWVNLNRKRLSRPGQYFRDIVIEPH